MPAIDKCSRHNMPRGMEDDGCAKSSGSNAVTCPHQPAKTLPMGHLNSSMPHTIGGGTIRGCRNNIRASRRRLEETWNELWKHPWKRHDSWKHYADNHGGRPRLAAVTQHRARPEVDEAEHRNRREDARTQNIWLFGA